MNLLFTLEQLQAAAALIYNSMLPTPQYSWPLLNQRLDGLALWVKHENMTPVGSFKIRGALTYLADLAAREPNCKGVIAATKGNFGQGVAFAAQQFDLPVTIVAPKGNCPDKNKSIQARGARFIELGEDFQESMELMVALAEKEGLHIIPSFDELLVLGTASIGLELFTQCPDLEVVYSGIGLGSNLCGLIAARDALGLNTDIIGVVSEHYPAYVDAYKTGVCEAQGGTVDTIADGLACRKPHEKALPIIQQGVKRVITVSDEEIKAAMRIYFDDTHHIAEGAGAAPLAALIKERQLYAAGQQVGVVLCGGNISWAKYQQLLNA